MTKEEINEPYNKDLQLMKEDTKRNISRIINLENTITQMLADEYINKNMIDLSNCELKHQNIINLNKYINFDTDRCSFDLTKVASELIYRGKQIICSYSGAVEWGHQFFCQLLDLCSGTSIYNYSLGCYEHKEEIKRLCQQGRKEEITTWVENHKDDDWFQAALDIMVDVINKLPMID